jgi:hypothetical protein
MEGLEAVLKTEMFTITGPLKRLTPSAPTSDQPQEEL